MSEPAPTDSTLVAGTGNTKSSRGASAKHWAFTLNNYIPDDIINITTNSFIQKYLFQEEVGVNGTPHLQGQLTFIKKQKLDWFKIRDTFKKMHVEKTKYIIDSCYYCVKTETGSGKIYSNWWYADECIFDTIEFKWWQEDILLTIGTQPDLRKIYWFWESRGGAGKSYFARYLYRKHGAMIVSGKLADMKHAIAKWSEENGYPHIIIIDIPRSIDIDFFSYTGVEEIKNGFFYSSKYEGGVVDMPRPHVIIFANEPPHIEKMSADKWAIVDINETPLVEPDDVWYAEENINIKNR
ncbi:MAG: replication associated protein [Wigfec virus K19_521]|nr:MAG: replication associated protein [Wigfec virus K19_521]